MLFRSFFPLKYLEIGPFCEELDAFPSVEYVIEKEGMKTKKEERHSCCSDDLNDRVHKKKKKGKMKGKRHHLA